LSVLLLLLLHADLDLVHVRVHGHLPSPALHLRAWLLREGVHLLLPREGVFKHLILLGHTLLLLNSPERVVVVGVLHEVSIRLILLGHLLVGHLPGQLLLLLLLLLVSSEGVVGVLLELVLCHLIHLGGLPLGGLFWLPLGAGLAPLPLLTPLLLVALLCLLGDVFLHSELLL
jgi:hypothetical protein